MEEGTALLRDGRFPDLPAGAIDPLPLQKSTRLRKPVVMLVQGMQGICLTIGIELLPVTDIRVATANSRFARIEIRRGIFPAGVRPHA